MSPASKPGWSPKAAANAQVSTIRKLSPGSFAWPVSDFLSPLRQHATLNSFNLISTQCSFTLSIKEDVYIRQPLGFSDCTFKVCHLKRCLYGLKQSPRELNMLLRAWFFEHGWQQCISDPCIYIFRAGQNFAMIALYVDDISAACNDATWLTSFKARMGARFKIKDLGDLSKLLGMHITRDRSARTISVDQSKCLRNILAKYGMTDCKPSSLTMDPGFLSGLAHMDSPPLTGVAKDVYPNLLGSF
jgi:hypothetical protein